MTRQPSHWLAAGLLGAFIAAVLVPGLSRVSAASARGHLVLVGGGPTPVQVFDRALALSGGRRATVAVLPQTFPDDSIADAAVSMWISLHAAEVHKVSRVDAQAALTDIERATLIWMPGGYPSYLMRNIRDASLRDLIRRRFAAGVNIGGASAGAMAMSEVMLADEANPDGSATHNAPTEEGLALWPEAIVSPHFTERRRLSALVPVVSAHPALLGIGIDEGTAVFVTDDAFEVDGRGTVSVLMAGRPDVRRLRAGDRYRFRGR